MPKIMLKNATMLPKKKNKNAPKIEMQKFIVNNISTLSAFVSRFLILSSDRVHFLSLFLTFLSFTLYTD